MDYTTLSGPKSQPASIRARVGRENLPVDDILDEAHAWIFSRLRVREMLTTAPGTCAVDEDGIDLPERYREMAGDQALQWTTPDAIPLSRVTVADLDARTYRDAAGLKEPGFPMSYAVGSRIEFAYRNDEERGWTARYYAEPPPLSEANPTHFLCTKAPRLLKAATLAFAWEFMRSPPDHEYWLGIAQAEIHQLHVENDRERGGATMVVSPE